MQMDDTIENTTLISRKQKITETAWPETKKDRGRNSRNDSTRQRLNISDHQWGRGETTFIIIIIILSDHNTPQRHTHTHTLLTKHPAAAPLRAGGGGAYRRQLRPQRRTAASDRLRRSTGVSATTATEVAHTSFTLTTLQKPCVDFTLITTHKTIQILP